MNGRKLTIAANNALPYLGLGERNPDGTYEPYSGLDLSILNTLGASMNFTYRVVRPPDGQWGYPEADGSISGMIGMAARREVHMAITGIAINAKRASVVDFTVPYIANYLIIITRARKERNRALAVLSPFSTQVWIYIIVTTLAIGPIMKIGSKLSQNIGTEESSLSLENYAFYMFRNLVVQGNPIVTKHWSQRLILISWYLYCFIVYAHYAGLLTATLIIPAFEKPIDSLQDLPEAVASGFTLSVVGGTTNEYIFKEATGGILKQTWELFNHKDRSKSFLPNPTIGLELILAEKYIHICPQDVGELLATKMGINNFYFSKETFFPQIDGFALPPGAPYKKRMDDL
ncbi:glutamate receptor ionotropic, delta-2-like [Palaemon carinicauda]|uniref:glutamate receptor ionotropic, delta-2-like n=1 Tax=Palaemon carinicauda TaxID=392227 RepID=UPI0035B68699